MYRRDDNSDTSVHLLYTNTTQLTQSIGFGPIAIPSIQHATSMSITIVFCNQSINKSININTLSHGIVIIKYTH